MPVSTLVSRVTVNRCQVVLQTKSFSTPEPTVVVPITFMPQDWVPLVVFSQTLNVYTAPTARPLSYCTFPPLALSAIGGAGVGRWGATVESEETLVIETCVQSIAPEQGATSNCSEQSIMFW